jgi:hypothetical protein
MDQNGMMVVPAHCLILPFETATVLERRGNVHVSQLNSFQT